MPEPPKGLLGICLEEFLEKRELLRGSEGSFSLRGSRRGVLWAFQSSSKRLVRYDWYTPPMCTTSFVRDEPGTGQPLHCTPIACCSGHWSSAILVPYRSPSPRLHPDPTPTHPTDPKRTETDRNGPEMDRNQALWGGTAGGFVGMGGVGVVREKENHWTGALSSVAHIEEQGLP